MIFTETAIPSAFLLEVERRSDVRGFFGRIWCESEFAAHGLATRFVQANVAGSTRGGTLRGMHYQVAPHEEAKLIRCTRGAVFDVVVDLRPASPAYLRWFGVELSEENHRLMYIPEGCAHGYQTLTDGAEVLYLVSQAYAPHAERGLRYDDPGIGIEWPLAVSAISEKDLSWDPYLPADHESQTRRNPASAPTSISESQPA